MLLRVDLVVGQGVQLDDDTFDIQPSFSVIWSEADSLDEIVGALRTVGFILGKEYSCPLPPTGRGDEQRFWMPITNKEYDVYIPMAAVARITLVENECPVVHSNEDAVRLRAAMTREVKH